MQLNYQSVVAQKQDFKKCYKMSMKRSLKRNHKLLMILIVKEGSFEITLNDIEYKISKGEMFILKDDYNRAYKFTEKTSYLCISFSSDNIQEQNENQLQQILNDFPIVSRVSVTIGRLAAALKSCSSYYFSAQNDETKDKYHPALKVIGDALLKHLIFENENRDIFKNNNNPIYEKALRYIEDYYEFDVVLQDIADYCKVTSPHISLLFRQNNSLSPMKYLWNLRITKAIELIAETKMPFKEIAQVTGFSSIVQFYRRLKPIIKTTPKKYRER